MQQSAGCGFHISRPGRAEDGSFRAGPEAAWAAPTLAVGAGSGAALDAAGHSCQGRASGLPCSCHQPRQTGAVTSRAAHAGPACRVRCSTPPRRADAYRPGARKPCHSVCSWASTYNSFLKTNTKTKLALPRNIIHVKFTHFKRARQ